MCFFFVFYNHTLNLSIFLMISSQALCVNEFKGETFECGSIPVESCQRTGKLIEREIEGETLNDRESWKEKDTYL